MNLGLCERGNAFLSANNFLTLVRKKGVRAGFLALCLAFGLGVNPSPSQAQFGKLLKGVEFVFEKGSREHIFSVFLLAALGSSDSAARNLEHFTLTGEWSSWESYLTSVESEVFSTELNAKLLGYGVVDMVLEGTAHAAAKWKPQSIGPLVSSFMGRQLIGIMGFWGWDVMREVHRCARAEIIEDLESESLTRQKIVLGRVDDLWDLFSRQPEIASSYFEYSLECLNRQDTYEIAKSRFLDFESLSFWIVLSASLEGGNLLSKSGEKFLVHQGGRFLSSGFATKLGVGFRRISNPLIAILLVGPLYRVHEDTVVRDIVNFLNFEFEEIRKDRAEKNLLDHLTIFENQFQSKAPQASVNLESIKGFEALRDFRQDRGRALGHHLSQIAVPAKTLTPFFSRYFSRDPAVRLELSLASSGPEGFKGGGMGYAQRQNARRVFRQRLKKRFNEYNEIVVERLRIEALDTLFVESRFVAGQSRRLDVLDTLKSLEEDFLVDFPFLVLGRQSFDLMERITLDDFKKERTKIDRSFEILGELEEFYRMGSRLSSLPEGLTKKEVHDRAMLGDSIYEALLAFSKKRSEVTALYLKAEKGLESIVSQAQKDLRFRGLPDFELFNSEILRILDESQKMGVAVGEILKIENGINPINDTLLWIEILGQLDNPEPRIGELRKKVLPRDPKLLRILGEDRDLLLREYIRSEFVALNQPPLAAEDSSAGGSSSDSEREAWRQSLRDYVEREFDARRRWVLE